MKLLLVAFLWLTCGFFGWGISLADMRYQNREYPYLDCRHDQAFAAVWGLVFGPISLVVSLGTSGFAEHGVQWTCSGENHQRRSN